MVDVIAIAQAELASVRVKIAALESEASDIEAFLRVAARFAAIEPQAVGMPAQTEPTPGLSVSDASLAAVESEAAAEGAHNPTSAAPTHEPDDIATILTVAHEKAAAAPPAGGAAASPAPMPPTLKQLVGPLMDEHPEWTAAQIADAIDRPRGSVAATMSVLRRERSSEAPKQAPPEPLAQVPEPVREVVRKPIAYPKGSRFYLRDEAGNYLHQSVQVGRNGKPLMTSDRAYAWQGSESQLVAVRSKLPETMDMRVEPIVAQQPARAA